MAVSRGLGTDLTALGANMSLEPDLSRKRPGGGGKANDALEGGGSSDEGESSDEGGGSSDEGGGSSDGIEVVEDESILEGILEDLLVDILEDGLGWLTKVSFSEVGVSALDWARLPLEPKFTEYSDVSVVGSLVVTKGWLTIPDASCLQLLCKKSTGNNGPVLVAGGWLDMPETPEGSSGLVLKVHGGGAKPEGGGAKPEVGGATLDVGGAKLGGGGTALEVGGAALVKSAKNAGSPPPPAPAETVSRSGKPDPTDAAWSSSKKKVGVSDDWATGGVEPKKTELPEIALVGELSGSRREGSVDREIVELVMLSGKGDTRREGT